MSLQHYLLLIAVAFSVTLLITPFVRRLAVRLDVVDYPGGRRVNVAPVPRLGGVAIFIGMSAAIAVQVFGESVLGWGGCFVGSTGFHYSFLGIGIGISAVFVTGLIDDFISLTPGYKLLGQVIGAVLIVASGLSISTISNPFAEGLISLGLASIPVTIIYLVAFSNIINLIDGLDGLAGGITVIAAASLFLLAADLNRLDAAIFAAVLIGACLAFLRYNSHPASVFMGDSGALTLGFMLGVISLLGIMRSTATIALAVPLIIVGVPIIDTLSAIIRRVKGHRPIQEADKGHIHHRLLRRGLGQRKTVFIIYGWSIILAVGGYVVSTSHVILRAITFVVLAVVSVLIVMRLGLWESATQHHSEIEKDVGEKPDDPNAGPIS